VLVTKRIPPQKALKLTFKYSEGHLYWKTPTYRIRIGDRAGCIRVEGGYHVTKLNNKEYKTHRLIWTWHYGEIPEGISIRHIDGDKLNNRIENLRL
jgi:hypothetical protein